MLKFKIGDNVKIMSGKDKGKEGKIEKILPKEKLAFIPGVNVYKKHVKASVAKDGKGGIYEISRNLPLSVLSIICPNCKKTTRVGFRLDGEEKVRICKKCKVSVENKVKK